MIRLHSFDDFFDYFLIRDEKKHLSFVIYYPDSLGELSIKRIELNSHSYPQDKAFRFRKDGWGLIHIFIDKLTDDNIKFRVSVNSKQRALNWREQGQQMGDPEKWDWKMVNKRCRKIIYNLRKMAIKN